MWEKSILVRMKHGWNTWMFFNTQMKKYIDEEQEDDEDYWYKDY